MTPKKLFIASLLLAAFSANAAEGKAAEFSLKPKSKEAPGQVSLLPKIIPPASPSAPASAVPGTVDALGGQRLPGVQDTSLLPPIAAVTAGAASAASAPAGAASLPAANPGLVPGQPVKVYATLGEAAKAGVDPLKDLPKAASAVAPVQPEAPAAFNWRDPKALMAWARDNVRQLLTYVALVLVAAGAGFLMSRNKAD